MPIIIWNGSKSLFTYLFGRRPTILGDDDSDISSIWRRMFFRQKNLPNVIVNDDLEAKLARVLKGNKKITSLNRGGIWSAPQPTPYPHLLLYGSYGVGKTLWAKQLAKQSGMHFIYMTVGDIAQLSEELALENIKRFFAMARRHAPTVLIIDEVDRLFPEKKDGSISDPKLSKIKVLFQREFSKAVDSQVQMVLITNFPSTVPGAIRSRCAKRIHFTEPNYDTKLRLFRLHLGLAGIPNDHVDAITDELPTRLIDGLVGRDIEAIANDYSVRGDNAILIEAIMEYKSQIEEMKSFEKPKQNKQNKQNTKPNQPSPKSIPKNNSYFFSK